LNLSQRRLHRPEVALNLPDSLALLADAAHNLTDVLGLGMAWGAGQLAKRASSALKNPGWKELRSCPPTPSPGIGGGDRLGRLSNGSTIPRRWKPTIVWVAALGTRRERRHGFAVHVVGTGSQQRGAFLHMAADAAVSAGVMLRALILVAGWRWLDSLVSLFVGFFILLST
jgi:cobalt-zinc-cadmium efflux system protein